MGLNFALLKVCSVFGLSEEELITLQENGLETKPKKYSSKTDRYQVSLS